MGAGTSSPETPPIPLPMEGIPTYPDMNVIFKGIPKMMQVADDMHRMTNYIMDLRNMTLGLSIISLVGMFFFLLLKYVQGKNSRRRRRRFLALDSDQNSLSRTGELANGNGTVNGTCTRYYSQKHHPSQFVSHLDWSASRHIPVDMEKLLESQHSNSTAAIHHHVGQMQNNGGGSANNSLFNRQTPPQQYASLARMTSYHTNHHHNHSVNGLGGGNATIGSAASGITSTTVALGDLNNDITDQEAPCSHSISTTSTTITSTLATTRNSSSVTTSNGGSTANGILSSHPLVIANNLNGGVLPPSTVVQPLKVSGVSVVSNVFPATTVATTTTFSLN